jgi:CRISPR/Cas system CMR subunit Cmr6 (Cas7 group RAMP superfamily)
MSYDYYLPWKTAELLTPDNLPQCKNLGLILDKYPPQAAVREGKEKGKWLTQLEPTKHINTRLARQAYTRWENATKAMGAEYFPAATDWRMVVGLGGNTVLETDLTLHHIYSIPLIPGSALKGVTRAYATDEGESEEAIQRIFGTEQKAGNVIFFDAMPFKGHAKIDLDIMNAHYPDYYGGEKLPTNTQDPNPVTFLTMRNTTFMFALALRRPRDIADMEMARTWLQNALEKYGVGGKTSAGYGFLTPIPQKFPTVGQVIPGTVIPATEELRDLAPGAKAFLSYGKWPTDNVLIVVEAEEAACWTRGQTRNCLFKRERELSDRTLLICQPVANRRPR